MSPLHQSLSGWGGGNPRTYEFFIKRVFSNAAFLFLITAYYCCRRRRRFIWFCFLARAGLAGVRVMAVCFPAVFGRFLKFPLVSERDRWTLLSFIYPLLSQMRSGRQKNRWEEKERGPVACLAGVGGAREWMLSARFASRCPNSVARDHSE